MGNLSKLGDQKPIEADHQVVASDTIIDRLLQNWKPAAAVVALCVVAGILIYSSKKTPPKTEKTNKKKAPKKIPKKPSSSSSSSSLTELDSSASTPSSSTSTTTILPTSAQSSISDLRKEEKKDEELSPAAKEEKATRSKEKGNKYYQAKEYPKAAELYSEAIALVPNGPDSHVYFGNRAACYQNLGDLEKALEDCTSSLQINPKYGKVLSRRGSIYEILGKYELALDDLTACCIFDGFQNAGYVRSADAVLKKIAEVKLADILKKREYELPSRSFVKSYLGSFCAEYKVPTETQGEGDELYTQALEFLQKMDYKESLEKCLAASDKETTHKANILNLIGTYYYLMGDLDGALNYFDQSLAVDSQNVNTIIKRSSLLFEKKDASASLDGFNKAIEIDPENPDIYYHRGQVQYLQGNLELSLGDYEKSVDLKSTVPFPHIQQAVVHYRNQAIQTAIGIFKNACKKFPQNGDVWNYFGEIMLDQGNLEEAENYFDKASQLNPSDAMCIINKGVLQWRAKQNIPEAIELMKQSIAIDPKCEIAYAQLGQIYQQIGKTAECLGAYDLAIKYTRSETELSQWISLKEAAAAQFRVFQKFPELAQLIASEQQF